jgi:hypothetical protein
MCISPFCDSGLVRGSGGFESVTFVAREPGVVSSFRQHSTIGVSWYIYVRLAVGIRFLPTVPVLLQHFWGRAAGASSSMEIGTLLLKESRRHRDRVPTFRHLRRS